MVMTAFRGDFGYKREELMIHLTFFRGAVGCAVYKRVRWGALRVRDRCGGCAYTTPRETSLPVIHHCEPMFALNKGLLFSFDS